ncbi:GntR family transcriptional regulator [Amycolatopsis sp. NPDC051372]|uniref:GntR family transcriptional regulator n=1 Tax=unclassified Amycolatopsis TaxID=2618356 RepID=UPI003413E221
MTTTPKEGEAGKHAALDALRAALLAGDVVPGQRLVEAELAETFGVTRASMRAALIDLTAEGLVERIPHRGARVRVVSVEEAVAITECRMVLEGLCAAKAAEKATDDEIDSLRELAVRLQSAVDDGESMKYSELNRELHRTVREIAGQSVAAELLERLHGQIVRHQFRLAMRAGRPHVSLPEHLAIIDAIARRDPDAAEQAARAHLRSVITALRETDN